MTFDSILIQASTCYENAQLSPLLGVVHTTSCPDMRLLGIDEAEISTSAIMVLKRSAGDVDILCDAVPNSVPARIENERISWINRFPRLHENAFMEMSNTSQISKSTLASPCRRYEQW
ncbi:MAG: hypothetical protein WDO06_03435 [Actinomycetota bacterium]